MTQLIIGLLLRGLCRINGLRLTVAETDEDLLAADTFRQNIYTQYYAMDKLQVTSELVRPKGLAKCLCLKKGDQIVGTVALIDLTNASSYAAAVFDGSTLNYDPAKTYEFTRLTLDRNHQRSDHIYFLLLVFACYRETLRNGRSQWLACSHKRVIRQIHNFGGKTQILAKAQKFATDGSYQAIYWSNLKLDERTLRDYRAYLVLCDKSMLKRAVKKFLKRKLLKLKWN